MKFKELYHYILAITIFFTAWVIYYELPMKNVFVVMSFLLLIGNEWPIDKTKFKRFMFFLPLAIYLSLPGYDRFYLFEFNTFLSYLVLPFFLLIKSSNSDQIYNRFQQILILVLVPGIIIHLVQLFGFFDIPPLKVFVTEAGRTYNIYPLLVQEVRFDINTGERFASIFDEPGYLGTLLSFVLVLNKFDFTRKKNILFFVSGVLTFSIAFYIMVILYFILSALRLNLKQNLIFVFLLIVLFIMLSENITTDVFNRLEIEDGWIVGDTRGGKNSNIEMFSYLFSQDINRLIFGNGNNYHLIAVNLPHGIIDSTWGRFVYNSGLFATFYFLLFIFYFSRKSFNQFLFALLFVLSIYQRPNIFTFVFLFLLSRNFIEHLVEKKNKASLKTISR